MATFGSLGAGLASGLEQHRQFGERQREFEAGQTDKRVTRGIELIGQLKTLIESDPRQKALVGDMLTSTAELVSGLTENEGWNSLAAGVLSAPSKEVVGEQIVFVDQTLDPARQMSESIAVLSTDVEGLRAARSNPNLREISEYEIPDATEAKKVDPNQYVLVGDRVFDVLNKKFLTEAPVAEEDPKKGIWQIGGGLWSEERGWLLKPDKEENYIHLKDIQGGLYNLRTNKWVVQPKEEFRDFLITVADGLYNAKAGAWAIEPTEPESWAHLKEVGGGLWNPKDGRWEVKPIEKDDRIFEVQGGLYNLDESMWEVEPKADKETWDHIKGVGGGLFNLKDATWIVQPPEGKRDVRVVRDGIFDVESAAWLLEPPAPRETWDHLRSVGGGLWNAKDDTWAIEPKGDFSHLKSLQNGLYNVFTEEWLVEPPEDFRHLVSVSGGLWNPRTKGWELEPERGYSHIKNVQNGLFDMSIGAWVVPPPAKPETWSHLKSVNGGLWNAKTAKWAVEPKEDFSHLKVVNGGLYDQRASVYVVEPTDRDRAWSGVTLVHKDPPGGKERKYYLDKNTQRGLIKELADLGYQEEDVTFTKEVVPEGAYESASRRDEATSQLDMFTFGTSLFDDAIAIMENDLSTVGAEGGIRKFGQEFFRIGKELGSFDSPGGLKDKALNLLADVDDYGEIKKVYFDDPDLTEMDILQNSLAAIYARVLNPKDRLLKMQLEVARDMLKATGLRAGESVLEKYKIMRKHMEARRKIVEKRSGRAVEAEGGDDIDAKIADIEAYLRSKGINVGPD